MDMKDKRMCRVRQTWQTYSLNILRICSSMLKCFLTKWTWVLSNMSNKQIYRQLWTLILDNNDGL